MGMLCCSSASVSTIASIEVCIWCHHLAFQSMSWVRIRAISSSVTVAINSGNWSHEGNTTMGGCVARTLWKESGQGWATLSARGTSMGMEPPSIASQKRKHSSFIPTGFNVKDELTIALLKWVLLWPLASSTTWVSNSNSYDTYIINKLILLRLCVISVPPRRLNLSTHIHTHICTFQSVVSITACNANRSSLRNSPVPKLPIKLNINGRLPAYFSVALTVSNSNLGPSDKVG